MMTSQSKRNFKIRNSIGVYDIYKLIRKEGWMGIERPLKDVEFYKIIRNMNLLIADHIALGETFRMPAEMGILELQKQKTGVTMIGDKLKINYPIDWKATTTLWQQDPTLKKKGVVVHREIPYMYFVQYDLRPARYSNKYFYQFKLNTFIKRALSQNITAGKVDTVWEGKHKAIY